MTTSHTLNEEQRRAVHAPIGPTLVPAGPGSGKTLVVANRVAWMIADMAIPADSILVFTFTNRAARELRQRLERCLSADDYRNLFAGTFHSWGAAFLRRHADYADLDPDYGIYDRQDSLELVAEAMQLAGDPDLGKSRGPRWRLESITRWKSRGEEPAELLKPWQQHLQRPPEQRPKHVQRLLTYQRYQSLLRHNNAADFEDLIALPLCILRNRPDLLEHLQTEVQHLIVDEYQDTSRNQHQLVTTIANRSDRAHPSIFIVGDSDQAIYAFRYADIRNINMFRQEDYPNARELQLQNNYRSTPEIIDAAQTLIEHNRERIDRKSAYTRSSGERLRWLRARNPDDEADLIADEIDNLLAARRARPEHICIAYRTNPQSRPMEEALRKRRILYQVAGGFEFFKRAEVRRHLDYLKLAVNSRDDAALKRIINIPRRGIGPKTWQKIIYYAADQDISVRGAIGQIPDRPSEHIDLRSETVANLRDLDQALTELYLMNADKRPAAELLRYISADCGLATHFAKQTDGAQRQAIINELLQIADETRDPDISRFLERTAVSLERSRPDQARVTLSTIHQTKGMEWPHVYVIGVEEELLPYYRHQDNQPDDIEEERRLLYVAMTRAESHLTLSWCRERNGGHPEPSRFIHELPSDCWIEPPPR